MHLVPVLLTLPLVVIPSTLIGGKNFLIPIPLKDLFFEKNETPSKFVIVSHGMLKEGVCPLVGVPAPSSSVFILCF